MVRRGKEEHQTCYYRWCLKLPCRHHLAENKRKSLFVHAKKLSFGGLVWTGKKKPTETGDELQLIISSCLCAKRDQHRINLSFSLFFLTRQSTYYFSG